MNGQNSETNRSTFRRWLGPVLLISLIINIFLGAHFVVGISRHFDRDMHGGPMMPGLPHGIVMQALSDDERRALRQTMRPHRDVFSAHFDEVRAARYALSEAVGAEPYDPERAKEAFEKLRNGMGAVASSSQAALAEAFAELSPETRKRIAETLKQPRRRPHGGRDQEEEAPDGD